MTAFRNRDHTAYVSREQHTDLWRVDCPTCGPVAIGQGYRTDAWAIAARHRTAHGLASSGPAASALDVARNPPETIGEEVVAELHGHAHPEHSRTHHLPRERLENDPDDPPGSDAIDLQEAC